MEASENKSTVENLKRRSRGDRRATSLPLFVFGVITLIGAAVAGYMVRGALYWALAFPVGFGFLFWVQRRRATRTGVGEGREPYGWFALGWLILVIPMGLILAVLAPLALVAAGLLAVAVHQRNRYLAGSLVAVVLAAFLLIAGSVAWRREMRLA